MRNSSGAQRYRWRELTWPRPPNTCDTPSRSAESEPTPKCDRASPSSLAAWLRSRATCRRPSHTIERHWPLPRKAISALDRLVLAHNNLAYHLHLLHDPEAAEHARLGMRLAQERGILWLQPYLYSTLGEIALAAGDLETAERNFSEGLAVAERHVIPERIAGLTANLGLVAIRRGQTALAIHRLSTALARADAAGTQHLAAQIRLWLAPLLPPSRGTRLPGPGSARLPRAAAAGCC